MLSRDERLRYLEQIESASQAWLADPEVASEYALASQAWDSAISPAILDDHEEPQSSSQLEPVQKARNRANL